MTEAPAILTRLTTGRRAFAMLGLVALALLNISAAAHQFEHSIDHYAEHSVEHDPEQSVGLDSEHRDGVCATCAAYSQLEDTAVSIPPCHETFVASNDDVNVLRTVSDHTLLAPTRWSRAPPIS